MLIQDSTRLNIVDVGASGGVHSRWSSYRNNINFILFEPCNTAYLALLNEVNETDLVCNVALSDVEKRIPFYLCNKQMVSSCFRPNIDLINRYPNPDRFSVIGEDHLNADTLDSQLYKNSFGDIDFIKIDTQGCELSILKGSKKTLNDVIGIECEVNFTSIYKDQPLFAEVDKFIRDNEFDLIDLNRHHWKRIEHPEGGNKGQLIFADALYFRSPEKIVTMANISQDKIVKSVILYMVYGYRDLAAALINISKLHEIISPSCGEQLQKIIAGKKRILIPNFRGKERIYKLLIKIANMFKTHGPYAGSDAKIGN